MSTVSGEGAHECMLLRLLDPGLPVAGETERARLGASPTRTRYKAVSNASGRRRIISPHVDDHRFSARVSRMRCAPTRGLVPRRLPQSPPLPAAIVLWEHQSSCHNAIGTFGRSVRNGVRCRVVLPDVGPV